MLDFELEGFSKMAKGFDPKKFEKQFQFQLTDTARKARTLVSQQIRRKYNVKAGLLGGGKISTVRIRKVKGRRILLYKAHMLGLEKMSATRVNVSTPRGKRFGVNVTVKKGNRQRVKGGFLGTPKNNPTKKFVFARVRNKDGSTKTTKTGKNALERKFTISVAHMVGKTDVALNGKEVYEHFSKGLSKRLAKIK